MENNVVNSIDKLVNQKQKNELAYQKLQRQRDLKVDCINKKFYNKIDAVLRRGDFLKMQIEQAKAYAQKNLSGGLKNE